MNFPVLYILMYSKCQLHILHNKIIHSHSYILVHSPFRTVNLILTSLPLSSSSYYRTFIISWSLYYHKFIIIISSLLFHYHYIVIIKLSSPLSNHYNIKNILSYYCAITSSFLHQYHIIVTPLLYYHHIIIFIIIIILLYKFITHIII